MISNTRWKKSNGLPVLPACSSHEGMPNSVYSRNLRRVIFVNRNGPGRKTITGCHRPRPSRRRCPAPPTSRSLTTMLPVIVQIADNVDGVHIKGLGWALCFGADFGAWGLSVRARTSSWLVSVWLDSTPRFHNSSRLVPRHVDLARRFRLLSVHVGRRRFGITVVVVVVVCLLYENNKNTKRLSIDRSTPKRRIHIICNRNPTK